MIKVIRFPATDIPSKKILNNCIKIIDNYFTMLYIHIVK